MRKSANPMVTDLVLSLLERWKVVVILLWVGLFDFEFWPGKNSNDVLRSLCALEHDWLSD